MSIGDFIGRVGDTIGNAPPEAWFSLAQALSSSRDPLQGLAQGAAGFGQQIQETRKKKSLADALQGAMGGMDQNQAAFAKALIQADPQQAVPLIGGQLFKAPTEKWEQIDSNGDGVPDRQKSSLTGKIDDIPLSLADRQKLAAAGASRMTVNNIPAEMGSRIGLGEGFLSEYESIKDRAKKFFGDPSMVEQVKRRGQIGFNTGLGGELWRDVEIGKEALVRQLTGSGMPAAEARDQARRYSISWDDTEFDALSKIDGLRQALINTASGAFKGRGGEYKPPSGGKPSTDNSDVDAILGLK